MTAVEPFQQMGQQRVFSRFQIEVDFGNEAVVDEGVGHGGRRGDEPGIPAHDLDQPHAVEGALGFVVDSRHRPSGIEHRRGETEGGVDETDVVVDGLGDGDDAQGQFPPHRGFGDGVGAPGGAVAADAEKQIHVHADQGIHAGVHILLAPAGTEDGAALFVNAVDHSLIQHEGGKAVAGIQPPVAVADPVDHRDAVALFEGQRQKLDHLVEAGAEPAGGENGGPAPGRIVKDLFPGPGQLEGGDLLVPGDVFLYR